MRTASIAGLAGLVLITTLSSAGDTKPKKEPPFVELPTRELDGLQGNWQAVLATAKGWTGTLHATATLKRDHPEESVFHIDLAVRYDLRNDKSQPPAVVRGNETMALFPCRQGNKRYVQLLPNFQVLKRHYLLEVVELRPSNKQARQELAELRPSARNTAAYTLAARTWMLETAPGLREFLPTGKPPIDWPSQLVWRRVR